MFFSELIIGLVNNKKLKIEQLIGLESGVPRDIAPMRDADDDRLLKFSQRHKRGNLLFIKVKEYPIKKYSSCFKMTSRL